MNHYEELYKIVKQTKAPYPGLIIDIVEYGAGEGILREVGYYCLRIYRDNFESFSENRKVGLATYLSNMLSLATKAGIKVYLEVEAYVPKR